MADKDFQVDSPEFSISVNLPADTSQKEVYRVAREQAEARGLLKPQGVHPTQEAPTLTTPEGTPTGGHGVFDSLKEKPNNIKGAGADIATAGLAGGAAGFVTPEAMKLGGAALMRSGHPVGEMVGLGLEMAGAGLEKHRLGLTLEGVLTGATSESAGQVADMTKFGKKHPMVGVTARVAGGVGGGAILHGLEHAVSGVGSWFVKAAAKAAGSSADKEATVETAKANLKILRKNLPEHQLNEVMAQGQTATLLAAQKKADKLIADAAESAKPLLEKNKPAALKLLDEGERQAKVLKQAARDRVDALTIASNGKTATAARTRELTHTARENVFGPSKELTDIGEELRTEIEAAQGPLGVQRKEADTVLRQARDAAVAKQEAQGNLIGNSPGIKSITDELAMKAGLTPEGVQAAGKQMAVTDLKLRNEYKRLHDSLAPREYPGPIGPDGKPLMVTKPPNMEALDAIRRSLLSKKPGAEGYAALEESFKKNMAERIAQVQKDYVPEQAVLQDAYHINSKAMRDVSTGLTRKAMASDAVNPEIYSMDAKELAHQYFYSAQKVEDLNVLIGPQKTAELAQAYLSRKFQGENSTVVSRFLHDEKETDWMRQVPGLEEKGEAYLKQLQRVEATTKKLEARAVELAKQKEPTKAAAEKAGSKAKEELAKQAEAIRKQSVSRHRLITTPAAATGAAMTTEELERRFRNAVTDWGSTDEGKH